MSNHKLNNHNGGKVKGAYVGAIYLFTTKISSMKVGTFPNVVARRSHVKDNKESIGESEGVNSEKKVYDWSK